MGGIIRGSSAIPTGSASSPGLPFIASPNNGIFMPADGGFGIALASKNIFDLSIGGLTLGYKPDPTYALTLVAGSPFLTGATPWSVTVSPDGAHVFAANNASSTVSAYSRNSATGFLTPVVGSPFTSGSAPQTAIVSPDGAHVIVVNGGSNTLAVFSRNSATGFLTPVAGSPFAAGPVFSTPRSAAITPDGAYVIVADDGTDSISVFSRNKATGFLSPVVGSPFLNNATPWNLALSPDGAYVFVTNYIAGTINVYSINIATGFLTIVAGSPFATGTDPRGVSVSPDGAHLLVANNGAAAVSIYSVVKGFLTSVVGSPFAVGINPRNVTVSPNNKYVMVTNIASNTISVFSRNSSTGFLTPVAGSPFAVSSGPLGVTVSPDGAHVLVADSGSNDITVFSSSPLPAYNLLTSNFDTSGGLGGGININGNLQVLGSAVLGVSGTDSRYAALAGLSTQIFSAANAVPATQNVLPIIQADGRYAALAGLLTQQFSALRFKASEAVNAAQGIATLSAGTITVANTSITANSRILITAQETGILTGILRVSARTAGTSFTISSSVLTDTATVAYEIFEPA